MKATFPKFRPVNPANYFKNFEPAALDLLLKMIALDPARRISMKEALRHPYFDELGEAQKQIFLR